MELLNEYEIAAVSGGDGWDIAEGALTGGGIGAGALGIAATLGFAVSFPVAVVVIGTSAAGGAAWEFFTDD